jgi:hypothetical protein
MVTIDGRSAVRSVHLIQMSLHHICKSVPGLSFVKSPSVVGTRTIRDKNCPGRRIGTLQVGSAQNMRSGTEEY